jgi:soluble lytic murein transglycosylase-like protein
MKNRIVITTALILVLPLITVALSPPTWQSHLQFTPLDIPLDPAVQEFTYYLADEYGVDFYLVLAMIKAESGYNSGLISRTNDYGLMQINKINHGWIADNLKLTDMLDPYQNIRAGVYILADLIGKYGTVECALMAYNLGESGANALWRGGVYETRYVRVVMENWRELKGVTE